MLRSALIIIALAFSLATTVVPAAAQVASPASANGPATTALCASGNRNWSCGTPDTTPSGAPITVCVETVQGGTVTDRRDVTFISDAAFTVFKNNAPAGTTYRVCGTTPSCTQSTVTTTQACPVGQTGSITLQQTLNVNGQCGVNTNPTEISNTCLIPPSNVCNLPWGGTIASGQSVIAYQALSVAFGGSCIFETRTCTNGVLSGSFTFQNCTINPPANCTLPWGGTIANGQSVTAYQTLTVPNGQVCASQTRTCNNGTLSGSYTFQNCTVNPPVTCALPWGGTINVGQSVTAYQTLTVANGQVCTSETRTCQSNGTLSGSFTYQNCTVTPPNSCSLPWGGTIADGQSVTAYQTLTVPNGQVCASQTRTCNNGVLSGSYTFQNCTVNPPVTCALPWGGTINVGQSVTAYQGSTVAYGGSCLFETRTCQSNGTLSGSYMFQNCTINPPASCALPWGGSIANGQSVIAYQNSAVAFGGSCVFETRVCNNGVLSGSYTYQNCTISPPANCALPWGGTLANGQSVTAYASGTVANGQQCVAETRTCTNGVLSGSYTYQNCTVQPTEVLILGKKNNDGSVTGYTYCTDRYAAIGMEYNPQLPYRVDIVLVTGGEDGRLGKNCLNTGHTGRLKIAEIPLGNNQPNNFDITVTFRAKIEGAGCGLTGSGVNGFMSRTVTLSVDKNAYSTSYISHVVDSSGNTITGGGAATAVVTQIPCIPYADFMGLAASGLFGQCPNNGQVKLPKYTIYANSPATFTY